MQKNRIVKNGKHQMRLMFVVIYNQKTSIYILFFVFTIYFTRFISIMMFILTDVAIAAIGKIEEKTKGTSS